MVLTRPYYDRFLLLFLALFMIFWFWVFYYFHSRPRSLCSLKSDNRGPHQKILSFTYFGTKDRFKEGLVENIETIPLIYSSEYIIRIYYDEFDETLRSVSELKLDHLDLCDVNRLTFDDFRISGKNPESSLKIDSKSFGQKSIHRTRAIISRS